MKQGLTLDNMARELARQLDSKRDYLADTRNLSMTRDNELMMIGDRCQSLPLTRIAHSQIAQRLSIPQAYYDRMQSQAPDLLATNVNTWFSKNPEQRMVRTLDGQVRAVLSHKYRALDNWDLAELSLPVISEAGCIVKSCALTPTHMYIKAVTPRITAEVKAGDVVQAGIVISNSEVGHGSLRVEPLIFRLVCLNGLISEASIRKYHMGARWEALEEENVRELLTDETRKAQDKAFWMKARDIINGSLNQIAFDKIVARLRETTEEVIEKKPAKVVELVSNRFGFNSDEGESILMHLIQGGDMSKYGLVNAVTRASQDVEDYDRATELERAGGSIVELERGEWKEISG